MLSESGCLVRHDLVLSNLNWIELKVVHPLLSSRNLSFIGSAPDPDTTLAFIRLRIMSEMMSNGKKKSLRSISEPRGRYAPAKTVSDRGRQPSYERSTMVSLYYCQWLNECFKQLWCFIRYILMNSVSWPWEFAVSYLKRFKFGKADCLFSTFNTTFKGNCSPSQHVILSEVAVL